MIHVLKFDTQGLGHCLYTEVVNLAAIGELQIARAASIEFNHQSKQWEVRDSENQLLFTHVSRSLCLDWELQYFNR
jgi:hypothetical protein